MIIQKNQNHFFVRTCSIITLCFIFSFSPCVSAMADQGIRQLTVGTVIPELMSIDSETETISSKIDKIPGQLAPELWSIESKAEVISSKIDTLPGQLTPELLSIESKAEVISSKTDILVDYTGCESIPLRSPEDIVDGVITLNKSGNYCLAMDMAATVSITAPNVCLDLNCRELTGSIIISAEAVTVKDGTVTAPAPLNNTDAEQAAITITAAGTRTQLQNLTVECLSLADTSNDVDGINGRSAVNNDADSVQIIKCQIQAGNGQGINRTSSGSITINRNTGSGGVGINNMGSEVFIANCIIASGSSGSLAGSITGTATNTNLFIGVGNTMSIGNAGDGIFNTGTNIQVTNTTILAGNSGNIKATSSGPSIIYNLLDIGLNGSAIIGSGGTGIKNTAADVQIVKCTITAGAAGSITATGNSCAVKVGYASGTAIISKAGDAILTTTNSSGIITDCMLSTTNGGSVSVTGGAEYGSADGNSGGNGITCDGANNLQIFNCLIEKTGNGGNGYRSNDAPGSAAGNGGNGGSGILVKSNCTNIEARRNSIANTGTYGLGGGSPAVNGIAGMAIQDLVSLGAYSSAIFENFASDIANTTQRYKINNSTTEGGRAQSECHDYLDNIYDNGNGEIYRTCSLVEQITSESWSIESKAEIISSKIDNVYESLIDGVNSINGVSSQVTNVQNTLDNPTYGLNQIVNNPTYGTNSTNGFSPIKTQLNTINTIVNDLTPINFTQPSPGSTTLKSATGTIYDATYQVSQIPYTGSISASGKYYLYQNESNPVKPRVA